MARFYQKNSIRLTSRNGYYIVLQIIVTQSIRHLQQLLIFLHCYISEDSRSLPPMLQKVHCRHFAILKTLMSHLASCHGSKILWKGCFPFALLYQNNFQYGRFNLFFDFLRLQPPISELPLKEPSHRLALLLCIRSGQLCQMIQFLNVQHMNVAETTYTFYIVEKLKNIRPSVHQKAWCFSKYDFEPRLCEYSHLSEYLRRAASFWWEHKQLLLSHVCPHFTRFKGHNVTLGLHCFDKAGIDISKYSCHSICCVNCMSFK